MTTPITAPPAEERPTHQRAAYTAQGPSERYIVPLLAERIPALAGEWRPRGPGRRTLDAGCGLQPFRALLEGLGLEYFSCDVVQNRAGTVGFLAQLDGELPADLANFGGFDFILCTEVLEHVADWPKAFQNLASLLREGGRILVTVPHFYPLHEVPYDYWRPTPFAVELFAQRSHLKVCHLEKGGTAWDVLGTFLAESRFEPGSGGGGARLVLIAAKAVRKLVESAVGWNWLRRCVRFRSPYFLSCLAVLEREAGATETPASLPS